MLFGVLGGWPYALYWSYQNWALYRKAWGYSRAPFWRDVHERTGYRVSPLFRALLSTYHLCLFPAVNRECRALGLRGLATPVLLALGYEVLTLARNLCEPAWRVVVSGAWPLLLVQLAINRMNPRVPGFRVTLPELAFVLLGGLVTWL